MKKILVVLLVLAVAGGVFAQEGSWSLNGEVIIGSFIDFDNTQDKDTKEPAVVHSSGYWAPYGWWSVTDGNFGINYSLGGLGVNLSFDQMEPDSAKIKGGFTYDGENFKFQAITGLKALLGEGGGGNGGKGSGADAWNSANIDRLWGAYNMLNGLVYLEVAFDSRDTAGAIWESDAIGAWYAEGNFQSPITNVTGDSWMGDYKGGTDAWRTDAKNHSFTANDHGNYLLTDIRLENLNFGVMIPNLFYNPSYTHGNAGYNYFNKDKDVEDRDLAEAATFPRAVDTGDGGAMLVADVLKKMIFGVKFQMQPVEFAAQLLMDDYAVYFGGKVFFGALTVGASFMGVLSPTDGAGNSLDTTLMRVGGSLEYGADAFGAGLKAWLGIEGETAAAHTSQFGVEPWFFYNVIPTHLQFRADVGFYFNNVYTADGTTKDTDKTNIIWGFQPQIFWNFLGTGAGSYWGFNTGMIVRYRMLKESTNALDVTFRFAF